MWIDIVVLSLTLSWTILFSPSMVIGSFAGYSSLFWHPWSLNICKTSVQALLDFRISVEKSGVILIGLPLSVTWPFYLAMFNSLSLFCMVSVLIMWYRNFLSGSNYLVFYNFLVSM